MPTRRHFLKAAAVAGGRALIPEMRADAAESRIDIALNEAIGAIAPEIYGHFVEHLGGVVYDGVWVGENSRIANVGGIRNQLVDALAKVKPGVIRWPGGCFADQYEDKFCLTPTYHVFDMYTPHQRGQGVRAVLSAPSVSYSRNGQPAGIPGLSASASLKGK